MSTIDMIDELEALEADLAALAARREEINAKCDAIKAERRADAIANVKGIMAAHGLTVADLAENRNRVVKVANPLPRVNGKVPVKFADGNGNTWTGRGQVPRWIQSAWNRADFPTDQAMPSHRQFAERFRIGGV